LDAIAPNTPTEAHFTLMEAAEHHRDAPIQHIKPSVGGDVLATIDTTQLVLWRRKDAINAWTLWQNVESEYPILAMEWMNTHRPYVHVDGKVMRQSFMRGIRHPMGRSFCTMTADGQVYYMRLINHGLVDAVLPKQTQRAGQTGVSIDGATRAAESPIANPYLSVSGDRGVDDAVIVAVVTTEGMQFYKVQLNGLTGLAAKPIGMLDCHPTLFDWHWNGTNVVLYTINTENVLDMCTCDWPSESFDMVQQRSFSLVSEARCIAMNAHVAAVACADGLVYVATLTSDPQPIYPTSRDIVAMDISPMGDALCALVSDGQVVFYNTNEVIGHDNLAVECILRTLNHTDCADLIPTASQLVEHDMATLLHTVYTQLGVHMDTTTALQAIYKLYTTLFSKTYSTKHHEVVTILHFILFLHDLFENGRLFTDSTEESERISFLTLVDHLADVCVVLYSDLYRHVFMVSMQPNTSPSAAVALLHPQLRAHTMQVVSRAITFCQNTTLGSTTARKRWPPWAKRTAQHVTRKGPVPLEDFHTLLTGVHELVKDDTLSTQESVQLLFHQSVPVQNKAHTVALQAMLTTQPSIQVNKAFSYDTSHLYPQPHPEMPVWNESQSRMNARFIGALGKLDHAAFKTLVPLQDEIKVCFSCGRLSNTYSQLKWPKQHTMACMCGGLWYKMTVSNYRERSSTL
jgi:hypothetical protein